MRVRLAIAAAAVVLVVPVVLPVWPREIYMRFRAARLAAQIERYHAANSKYPISLLDIAGAPVNGPIYYERDLESPKSTISGSAPDSAQSRGTDSKTRTWHGPQ